MRWSSTPLRRASIASILGLVTPPENVRLVCTCANLGMDQWGEEVMRRVAIGMRKKEASPPAPTEDEDRVRQQRAKLAAAERLAQRLSGEELKAQRRRIAALKRSTALGPTDLNSALFSLISCRCYPPPISTRGSQSAISGNIMTRAMAAICISMNGHSAR